MKKNKIFLLIISGCIAVIGLCFPLFKSKKTLEPPYLTVVGPVCMADELGRQSVKLLNSLKDEMSVGFRFNEKFILEGVPKNLIPILKDKKRSLGKVVFYKNSLGLDGLSFKGIIKGLKNPNHIRIAYSVFESSLIPAEWVESLNHYFDIVAVPDKFLIEVYKNSGVTIPIFELPLGLDLEKFYQETLKSQRQSPLIFANFSSAIPRHNQLKLIQAFHRAFGDLKDVKLILNSSNSDAKYSQEIKNELHKLQASNIVFTEMVWEQDLYLKIFKEIDCYVSLSLGEGLSIEPKEAIALGIPLIVTDNTAQRTLCQSLFCLTVSCLDRIPAFYPEFRNHYGVFSDCTLEDASYALRDMYDNYEKYLAQAQAKRAWAKKFSYDHLKPLYLGLVKPKKIALADENKITPDCLYTTSKEVCDKYHQLIGVPIVQDAL